MSHSFGADSIWTENLSHVSCDASSVTSLLAVGFAHFADSAPLGAALRAVHGYISHNSQEPILYKNMLQHLACDGPSAITLTKAVDAGSTELWEQYGKMVKWRMHMEQVLLNKFGERAA